LQSSTQPTHAEEEWTVLWPFDGLAPIRVDADMDVIEIRFSDKNYAGEFRKANSQATSRLLTDSPPFFMRPLFWKIVCLVALLAFIGRMVNH
jgi:hypothetical protein